MKSYVQCWILDFVWGILSPVLFNLYDDDLINQLKLNGDGCYVGKWLIGCIVYMAMCAQPV